MAATAREATQMSILARLKRLFIPDREPVATETHILELRVKLAELEQSQRPLKRAVEDTGFFLGDALVRQQHERNRAHNHSS